MQPQLSRRPPREGEPRLDPLATTPEALARALAARPDDVTLSQALVDVLAGVSPQLAREVAYRLAGDAGVLLGAQRDQARLLVLCRVDGRIAHRSFRDLLEYLRVGDVLILQQNSTRDCQGGKKSFSRQAQRKEPNAPARRAGLWRWWPVRPCVKCSEKA